MSSTTKTVLVTGANGYLGSAVVLHFLEHGYHVKATVRTLAKADGLKAYLLPKYEGALSFVVIDDMTRDGVYEEAGALDGVDAVCHVASPLPDLRSLAPPAPGADIDWVRDMVTPAKEGTLTILCAASTAPQVTHVCITSSMAAVRSLATRMSNPATANARLTEADWNPATADDPANKLNALAAYFASKTEAERAAWHYLTVAKPHYTIATFCPPVVLGPAATRVKGVEEVGSTLGLFYRMMKGEPPAYPMAGSYVDVRDIAIAFRLVIEQPLKQSERFLLAAGAQTGEEVLAFATSLEPAVLEERETGLDTTKARQLLGWAPRSKRETFVDMAAYLQEAEKSFSSQ